MTTIVVVVVCGFFFSIFTNDDILDAMLGQDIQYLHYAVLSAKNGNWLETDVEPPRQCVVLIQFQRNENIVAINRHDNESASKLRTAFVPFRIKQISWKVFPDCIEILYALHQV